MTRHYIKSKVIVYAKQSTNDWSSSGTTLTDVWDVDVRLGLGNKKDVFSFKTLTSNMQYIDADYKCRLYLWKDSASESADDLIIEGTITNPSFSANSGGADITIDCTGFVEVILNALTFARTPTNNTPPKIIQAVLAQLNQYNRTRKIYGEDATEWAAIGNDTTKSNGAAFTDIQYDSAYKRAIEIIEEVSGDKYTGDGQYIYNVIYNSTDDRYEFWWRHKSLVSTGNTIVEGVSATNLRIYRSTDDIINCIIYNVGSDCNEITWEFLNPGASSMSGQGSKWRYVSETSNILPSLIEAEFEANRASFPVDADGRRTSNYPTSTAAWTFQFKTRNAVTGAITGTDATATDDTTYNEALISEAEWLGKFATDRIIDLYSAPRIKAEVTVQFDNTHTVGDLYEVTSTTFDLTSYPLRLQEIKHTNFETTLYLEEDETTAIANMVSS